MLEFKMCFGCIPLRKGLITWGYLKLVYNILSIAHLVTTLCWLQPEKVQDILYLAGYSLIVLADTSFTVLFITAGHKKSVELLHISYIYSIVWLCLLVLNWSWFCSELSCVVTDLDTPNCKTNLSAVALYLVVILLQVYLILLIRSEVIKLRSQSLEKLPNENNIKVQICTDKVGGADPGCTTYVG